LKSGLSVRKLSFVNDQSRFVFAFKNLGNDLVEWNNFRLDVRSEKLQRKVRCGQRARHCNDFGLHFVEGESARRNDHRVIFTVTDSGPGIPPDVKDKVFDWFESHSHGSRHRGAGLGLSLVRSFVELHGGKVQVDSVVGKGTTVTCDFPIDQNAHRNAAE